MPIYEYLCRDCQTEFEALVSAGNRDSGETRCPCCGAQRTARKISLTAPAVVKSGGSAVPAFDCGAPGGCCGGACAME